MPIKYECPKCGRRFTEWGAEKAGFKCPKDQWCTKDHPEDVELVKVGASQEGHKRPSLKRATRRSAALKSIPLELSEDEVLVPDIDEIDAEDTDVDEEEEEEAFEAEDEEDLVSHADAEEGVDGGEGEIDEELPESEGGIDLGIVDEMVDDSDDL